MKTVKQKNKINRKKYIFIFLMLLWPVLHFVLMQFLNLNMVIMAFNDYTLGANNPVFVGLENFKGVFRLFDTSKVDNEWYAVKNSLSIAALTLFVNAPMALAFSYLLYIKVKGSSWMKVVLYLPCVTSAVVLVLIFKSFMTSGPVDSIYSILGIYDKLPNEGWLGEHTAWNTILLFSIWTGFSQNMIFFLAAMNRIPQDYVEAAKIDGASEPRIFFSIVLPMISSTVGTMLTLSLSAVFGWCMPSMLMMRNDSGMNFTGTMGLSILRFTSGKQYGVAAAYGLILTVIGAPITLLIRKISMKLSTDVEC